MRLVVLVAVAVSSPRTGPLPLGVASDNLKTTSTPTAESRLRFFGGVFVDMVPSFNGCFYIQMSP